MDNNSFQTQAAALLAFAADDPRSRALRSAAIYASLFEEDPQLHEWCGIAAWFATLQASCSGSSAGFYSEMFGRWCAASYDLMMPEVLRFRAGEGVEGPLAEGFWLLTEARDLRKKDRDLAGSTARRGIDALVRLEQELAVQPLFDGLPEIAFRGMGAYVSLSFGETTPEPLVFEGVGFPSLPTRQRWLAEVVVPAWRNALRTDGAGVVGAVRQMQFKGWYNRAELPPRARPA